MENYTIKTTHMKNLGFFVAEAFVNGQCLTFAQGATKKEAEQRLQEKVLNRYHLTHPQ